MKNIYLKSSKEWSLIRQHPWVFSGAIKTELTKLQEGEIVKIYSNNNQFLGIGHYQIGSIAIRIFSFQDVEIDYNFWRQKINAALEYRKILSINISAERNNVYRIIHGEGDSMPGFVCDYYNKVAVLQFHSVGMFLLKDTFAQILTELLGNDLIAIYDKSDKTLPFKYTAEDNKNALLYGNVETPHKVTENNLDFLIDFQEGQKTGFFIDQRQNRCLLAEYSKNKNVLNTFCYTGAFSVYAINNQANIVHSVDSSKKAIELTEQNVEINFGKTAKHTAFLSDVFTYIEQMQSNFYDLIILDPPAFAKHLNAIEKATKGYINLNYKALLKIKTPGILFTFSCSQVILKEDFRKIILEAAVLAKKRIKIIHQISQPIDHPINIYHPESEYLKGLILYVED